MIDFTTNALIALWFACQEKSEINGKVVAINSDNTELFSTVGYGNLNQPIKNFLYQDDKLWKWVPSHLSDRIIAQQSVFVFGRGKIEETHYQAVKIDGGCKEEIRRELRNKFGINEQYLFSDFTGFALSNAHDRPYTDYTTEQYLSLGLEFVQRGDFENAIEACNKAISLDPENTSAYNIRGIAKDDSGDYLGAIADYDKAIEINPEYASAYFNRGNSKRNSGDTPGAITDYDKAIAINPEYASAYINRGNSKRNSGDTPGAITDYDKAIEISPDNSSAYINRGVAKNELGNNRGAIVDYNKAIEINPEHASAYFNRGKF